MKESSITELLEIISIPTTEKNILIVSSIINSTDCFYRSFNIPKRKGGFRNIHAPYPTLHLLQSKIKTLILDDARVSVNAFAYVKNRSYIEHAKCHCGCNELLTLDIKDFFPNISRQNVFKAFSRQGLSEIQSNYLSYLCTLNDSLPQGACTSPSISNIVFSDIDNRLNKLALSFGLKYSRYADDLAFSGDYVPNVVGKIVCEILLDYGFTLNKRKTKLKKKGSKKIITGVSISSGEVKAPKAFKRSLRAEIFELEKNKDNLIEMPNFEPMIYEKLLGKLNYLLQVEPENNYAINKKNMLISNYKEFVNIS
ncbi:reverse transcriptase family protein [Photobacterium sagamiensis]|uniref:reverse transcriptase family protein n=1 Tax=Photobacterium sagamiensis TaxID=2910241 RepID=UPI003D0D7A10